jgi:hypothetical protein
MIIKRLEEIRKIEPPNVLVSIDYKDPELSNDMNEILAKYSSKWPSIYLFNYRVNKENLGLVSHLTQTITESLREYECVIIIEDDISISQGFYDASVTYMNSMALRSRFASFGGFSILPKSRILERLNGLRPTPYFACWGWVISRENWIGYTSDLSGEDFSKTLNESKVWNQLKKKQKETWIGRFNKARLNPSNTWDIQFQYHSFIIDKMNLVPIFRLVDNEGFSDSRSTHTQSIRPLILGKFGFSTHGIINFVLPVWVSKTFIYIESIVFFEDSPCLQNLKKVIKKLFRRQFHEGNPQSTSL